jgi:Tfp pilus assembly major pilin PilA
MSFPGACLMAVEHPKPKAQRGVTLLGLMLWAILIGIVSLVALRVLPTVNEYLTIQRAVDKVAGEGLNTVPEIRLAFDRQKEIEYSISSITGKDLKITKEDDHVVIRFAYDKQIDLMPPVYLLIKYEGQSKPGR